MFDRVRLLGCCLTAALASCGLATSPSALAAQGGQKSVAPALSLVSEYIWNSPNPIAPTWCLNEDDWHVRTWTGGLSGTFTASERLCDYNADFSGGMGWDAGGVGLQADLVVAGTLSDLAITSPQGDSHHGVFADSTTSKGVTLNHYRVCYVPPYMLVNDIGFGSLTGGDWQIALSGNVTKVSFTLRARMADVNFQQQYCPSSQQNLH